MEVNVTGFSLPVAMAFSADAAGCGDDEDDLFGNTVTTTCAPMMPPGGMAAMCRPNMGVDFTPIPPQHFLISVTLTTSNLIMASWSRYMWQSVGNRVLRMITTGPFGTHFATAVATVT
ncbi:hypothetical protein KIN20_007089 [Parelaphostrongylus tenuis]|uniref:Uncharacterized protein n=1 Tax=Parelaphostrongylus tenuis TaxID=148309 RepID=A0AAD5MNK5_PARTN|nr:hypothetical protein KIN20_007089 [Parelaphostrongylus tenuis]